MAEQARIGERNIRLTRDDITLMDVDAFVFYARPDLKLGSGYGNAIAVRGGPSIQEELDKVGGARVGEAVATSGGKLKARHIIHAVGPAFAEPDTEQKLRATVASLLARAEELGVERLAVPPLGSGFYGVPPQLGARVGLEVVGGHLASDTSRLREVVFCLPDTRDMQPFRQELDALTPNERIRS